MLWLCGCGVCWALWDWAVGAPRESLSCTSHFFSTAEISEAVLGLAQSVDQASPGLIFHGV